jgi:hypothetical protein
MARRKTPPSTLQTKHVLAERIMALRMDLFGPRGGPELARRLGIPVRTWYNYEGGITVPGEILLKIIEVTSVEPMWLLHGTGPRFSDVRYDPSTATASSAIKASNSALTSNLMRDLPASSHVAICTLLRAALRLLGGDLAEPPMDDEIPMKLDGEARPAAIESDGRYMERSLPQASQPAGNGSAR